MCGEKMGDDIEDSILFAEINNGSFESVGISEIPKFDIKINIEQENISIMDKVVEIPIYTKLERKHMIKIGIQHITRKRFIKLLMGQQVQKRDAEKIAKFFFNIQGYYRYCDVTLSIIVFKQSQLLKCGTSDKKPVSFVKSMEAKK
ncbi:MAG: hypothetical protein IJ629_06120 [Clostridia bacterium]|nr:hypothetical protein [Clostridia bacterium]